MNLEAYPELIKCIEGGVINSTKNSIEIGNKLLKIKEQIKTENQSWLEFVKEKFNLSVRSCQTYMRLAKTPIHENHYKLGITVLDNMISSKTDLSHSVIDRFCQGCVSYKNGEGCFGMFDNQTGDCPCTNCEFKSSCSELCLSWYEWDEKNQ